LFELERQIAQLWLNENRHMDWSRRICPNSSNGSMERLELRIGCMVIRPHPTPKITVMRHNHRPPRSDEDHAILFS
jgi:hypothetical protein